MKKSFRCAVMVMLMLTLYNVEANAQFYTVNFISLDADTLSTSVDPYTNGLFPNCGAKAVQASAKGTYSDFAERSQPSLFSNAKLSMKEPIKKQTQEKGSKTIEKSFPFPKRKIRKSVEFPLFNATDSLLLDLIKKRLTVCMPLDLIHINSPYGYRKDPFKQCQKFHDGIDLKAGHELVYCMLPGKVAEVKHGNTGYGNYIIIDHGKLRCLYAHLSEIYAKEGNIVDAGAIVGLTGSTGRSTGEHLHLAMRRKTADGNWESVNPLPFINSLNDYINEYNEKLALLTGNKNFKGGNDLPELTIANLYAELKKQGVKHPKIVLAQALLESAYFKSKLTRTHNNIFGIRKRNGDYQAFDHWTSAVTAYRDLVQYKFRDGRETYGQFLSRIGYAEDPLYINKVMKIAKRL